MATDDDEKKFNEMLKRMLKTPPNPHDKPDKPDKPKPKKEKPAK